MAVANSRIDTETSSNVSIILDQLLKQIFTVHIVYSSIGEDPNELVETDTLDDIPAVSGSLQRIYYRTVL